MTGAPPLLPSEPDARASALSPARRTAGWVAALVAPVAASALLHLVPATSGIGLEIEFLVFLTLVVFVALAGGLWPALASALLGTVALNWFFTDPIGSLRVDRVEAIVALVLFIAVAIAVAGVVDSAARRAAQARAARARAELLAELSGSVLREGPSVTGLLDQLRASFGQRLAEVRRLSLEPLEETDAPRTVLRLDERGTALVVEGRRLREEELPILEAFAGRIAAVLTAEHLAESRREAERAEESAALRAALLAGISHDLRTPLAAIKASSSTLLLPGVVLGEEERHELIAGIDGAVDRLDALIAGLLEISRAQLGTEPPERVAIAVSEVLPEALASLGLARDLLAVEATSPEPRALADPVLLGRILANLVQNARRHGGGRVRVLVLVSAEGGRVLVRVADRGPGIPEERRESVFEPFRRLGDGHGAEGLGLGLAVARSFAEAMGARLTAHETPGGGATLELSLEAAP